MYVCICNGITDRAIREAAERGARDFVDLSAMTGCGSSCGSCVEIATRILVEARQSREFPLPLLAA